MIYGKTVCFALIVAGVIMSFAPVLAQDADAPDAVISDAGADWTGYYAGGHLGWTWGDTKWYLRDADNDDHWWGIEGDSQHLHSNGVMGGIQAGYMHQLQNNVVLGIDLALSLRVRFKSS